MKLCRAWSAWLRREPACVIDGEQVAKLPVRLRRRPLASLGERLHAGKRGVVLLLDHAHTGAADVLHSMQQRHGDQFAAGAVVIGVENLPSDDGAALDAYRRMAHAPVFGVDLRRACDVLLLDEALVATRVTARLLGR